MVRLFLVCLQAEAEAKKEDRPKSPGILSKLLAPFKDGKAKAEKKVKAPKSPKKEKKKELAEVSFIVVFFLLSHCDDYLSIPQAPATEESSKAETPVEAPKDDAASPIKET